MSVPRLIVMLTYHDVTVKNAKEIFMEAKDAPAEFWGFKDVGLSIEEMKDLVKCMKDAGKTTFMECLAHNLEDTKKGIDTALECGFDILLGAHYFKETEEYCFQNGLKHSPFIGYRSEGKLYGTIEDIVNEAVSIAESTTAYGINVSGYRYQDGDPEELISSLREKLNKPLSVAGSVDSYSKLDALKRIQPWAFTIGGAFFENKFGNGFSDQIRAVQDYLKK